jgi:circadian clock protein KaiC
MIVDDTGLRILEAPGRVSITTLPTAVPGLDEVLGGGIPEYSFNLIAGAPGTGKTTLSQQIMFALANPERPALHFTVAGEPSLKLLRYQQQFDFFDTAKVGSSVHYVNLSAAVEQGLEAVLQAIQGEVEQVSPAVVVVDSFRAVVRAATGGKRRRMKMQRFLERLAIQLTSWEATTFLVGEYGEGESTDSAVFTVADWVLWLYQSIDRNSAVRVRVGIGPNLPPRLSRVALSHGQRADQLRGDRADDRRGGRVLYRPALQRRSHFVSE